MKYLEYNNIKIHNCGLFGSEIDLFYKPSLPARLLGSLENSSGIIVIPDDDPQFKAGQRDEQALLHFILEPG